MDRMIKMVLVFVAIVSITACGTTGGQVRVQLPQTTAPMGSLGYVQTGVVEAISAVMVTERSYSGGSYAGGLAGGAIGAAIGSKIGNGNGRKLAMTVLGAYGAKAGYDAGNSPAQYQAYEIIVRLDSGRTIAVTQSMEQFFNPGQRVRIIEVNGRARVSA